MSPEQIREARALCPTLDRWDGYAVKEDIDGDLQPGQSIYGEAARYIRAFADAIEERDAEIARLRRELAKMNEPMPARRRPVDPTAHLTPERFAENRRIGDELREQGLDVDRLGAWPDPGEQVVS